MRGAPLSAFVPESDAASREVVGGDFEGHSVSCQHADAKAAHFAGDRRVDFVPVRYEHPECRIREHFSYRSFELDCFFFRHKTPCSDVFDVVRKRGHPGRNRSGPVLVTLWF